jgi:hypothetical protein
MRNMAPVMSTATAKGAAGVTQCEALDVGIDRVKTRPAATKAARKPRCEDCFFHQKMLCALEEKKPCPTFRPAHPDGLRPPQQLSFVFRQGRRADPFSYDSPRA